MLVLFHKFLRYIPLRVALVLLAVVALLRVFLMDTFRSQQQYVRDIERNVQKSIQQIDEDAAKALDILERSDSLSFTRLNADIQSPFFIFESGQPVYWSDYRFVPQYKLLKGDYRYQFKHLPSGDYVVRQDTINNRFVYFLLPVYQENNINNQYISSEFNKNIFPQPIIAISHPDSVAEQQAHRSVIQYQGQNLFAIYLDNTSRAYREHDSARFFQILMICLLSIAILLICYYIFSLSRKMAHQRKADAGFMLLAGSLFLLRLIMLWLSIPSGILPNELFDGRYYALSAINPSLGDLLLNALGVLLLIIYLFRYYSRFNSYQTLFFAGKNTRTILSVALLLIPVVALYVHYYFTSTIYFNSHWTLDITESINFSFLKIISLIIFVINTASYFLLAHMSVRISLSLTNTSHFTSRISFLIAISITLFLVLLTDLPFGVAMVSACYFGLLYLFRLPKVLSRLTYVSFLYVFTGALVCAVTGAIAAYHMKQVNQLDSKQKFANRLLVDNDVFGEYLLNESMDKISRDPFIKRRLFGLESKDIIKQKVKRIYLSDYFDKYDIQVYLFNLRGKPMDKSISSTYQQLRESVAGAKFLTEYENIFFIDESTRHSINEESFKRYLAFVDMQNFGKTIGHIVIDLTLKRFIPNRVYPELLIDNQYLPFYPNDEYDYAIFSGAGKMIYISGEDVAFKRLDGYNFKENITNEQELNMGDYNYLIIDGEGDEYIVISSTAYSWTSAFSNFSFLFLILVFVLLLLLGLYAINFAFRAENLSFSTKIQLYLNAAFFMPLLAVSLTTLSVISRSYRQEVDRQYLQKAEQISENLVDLLNSYQEKQINEETLANTLSQVSQYAETDANIFDTNGKLVASSQPAIYTQDLLSEYMNPVAFAGIKEQGEDKLVLDESVGRLSYKSSYTGLRSFKSGKLIGFVSLPFFESDSELEKQIIQVLTNIMDIFTIVFIVFLVVSYLASVLLTYPLLYITQKIRKTSLSDYNAPLSWESNDEIGLMIGEYNRMLVNLEASKAALARTEKESAWREMAKQVAHEIKNPLTPMRLSLQLLKRKLENDYASGISSEEVRSISKPVDNMLHQVDTLNDIASSFSNFAQMPLPKSEPYELSSIVKKTVGLFEGDRDKVQLEMDENAQYLVVGDKQLMGRILSNLIINAKQSVPKDREPNIQVSLHKTGIDKIIIKVSDNGTGIAKEIQHKVFLPNFSTKYAGSGIGLAIAKRGIEHAGGRIAFDSKDDIGTTFFIELPLMLDQKLITEEKN